MPRQSSGREKRRNWRQRYIIWPLEAIAVAVPLLVLALLPRRLAAWLGGALIGFVGPLSRQHARAMSRNLAIAFPHLSSRENSDLQKRIWRHFGRILFTLPHLPRLLRRGQNGSAFEIEGARHLANAAKSGSFILVGAHFGHWEAACCHAALSGYRVTALYTPPPNPWIDATIRYLRARAGPNLKLVPRVSAGLREFIESLRRGEGLFLLVDRRVNEGAWQPFFGRPARTTTSPARLARRFHCAIVPCRTLVLSNGRYRISYYEPLRPDPLRPADADIARMTLSINSTFECWIREQPDQWLCTKGRWPKECNLAQPSRTGLQDPSVSPDSCAQAQGLEVHRRGS